MPNQGFPCPSGSRRAAGRSTRAAGAKAPTRLCRSSSRRARRSGRCDEDGASIPRPKAPGLERRGAGARWGALPAHGEGLPGAARDLRRRVRHRGCATARGRGQPRAPALGGCVRQADRGLSGPGILRQDHETPVEPRWDRRANAALHRIVLVRLRWRHPPTIDYVARRTAEGRSKREIIRCLKRYVAREVYRALTDVPADASSPA